MEPAQWKTECRYYVDRCSGYSTSATTTIVSADIAGSTTRTRRGDPVGGASFRRSIWLGRRRQISAGQMRLIDKANNPSVRAEDRQLVQIAA